MHVAYDIIQRKVRRKKLSDGRIDEILLVFYKFKLTRKLLFMQCKSQLALDKSYHG